MSDIALWEGIMTARTSIVHSSQSLGTVKYLNREKFIDPNGEVNEYPLVSGNAMRGILRDIGAELFWEDLGKPKLTLPVVHALWSGGSLMKAKTEPLSGMKLATLRGLVSPLGIFGAAGGGRIVNGTLSVNKLIPICEELSYLLPEKICSLSSLPSIYDLTQIEYATRVSDFNYSGRTELIDEQDDLESDNTMRYGHESFLAGTQFHCKFVLTNASDNEKAFFQRILDDLCENGRIGARRSCGHGEFKIDWLSKPDNLPDYKIPQEDPKEIALKLRWLN